MQESVDYILRDGSRRIFVLVAFSDWRPLYRLVAFRISSWVGRLQSLRHNGSFTEIYAEETSLRQYTTISKLCSCKASSILPSMIVTSSVTFIVQFPKVGEPSISRFKGLATPLVTKLHSTRVVWSFLGFI